MVAMEYFHKQFKQVRKYNCRFDTNHDDEIIIIVFEEIVDTWARRLKESYAKKCPSEQV